MHFFLQLSVLWMLAINTNCKIYEISQEKCCTGPMMTFKLFLQSIDSLYLSGCNTIRNSKPLVFVHLCYSGFTPISRSSLRVSADCNHCYYVWARFPHSS